MCAISTTCSPTARATATGEPTVTVIIPVFDDTRYLDEAVDSVLAQTHRPFDVIVVDDGSAEPVQLATRFTTGGSCLRARSQHHEQGAARKVHGGVVLDGELLAFLDADDVWLPRQARAAGTAAQREDQQLDMVFGGFEEFVSPDVEGDDARPCARTRSTNARARCRARYRADEGVPPNRWSSAKTSCSVSSSTGTRAIPKRGFAKRRSTEWSRGAGSTTGMRVSSDTSYTDGLRNRC